MSECPLLTYGSISCIRSKFTEMSAHPEASFTWLMKHTHGVDEAQPGVLYMSECPLLTYGSISCIRSKFTEMSAHPEASFTWLMKHTHGVGEAQPRVLYMSEVRNYFTETC